MTQLWPLRHDSATLLYGTGQRVRVVHTEGHCPDQYGIVTQVPEGTKLTAELVPVLWDDEPNRSAVAWTSPKLLAKVHDRRDHARPEEEKPRPQVAQPGEPPRHITMGKERVVLPDLDSVLADGLVVRVVCLSKEDAKAVAYVISKMFGRKPW